MQLQSADSPQCSVYKAEAGADQASKGAHPKEQKKIKKNLTVQHLTDQREDEERRKCGESVRATKCSRSRRGRAREGRYHSEQVRVTEQREEMQSM